MIQNVPSKDKWITLLSGEVLELYFLFIFFFWGILFVPSPLPYYIPIYRLTFTNALFLFNTINLIASDFWLV